MRRRNFLFFAFLIALVGGVAGPAHAQNESQFAADLRHEGDKFKESCGHFDLKSFADCGQLLFTGHPFHIAAGSIAPQNGFSFGPSLVAHLTPNESWRLSWNADLVASTNGSWRAGVYMKSIYIKPRKIVMKPGGPPGTSKPKLAVQEYPVLNVYAEGISLNKITYFGLGPATTPQGRSFFGMREVIAGGSALWPVYEPLKLSLYGEANGRFVDIRGSRGQSSPSIEQIYTDATAPGLSSQPGFAQFGEGIRIRPALFGDHLRLNYSLTYQQFVAAGDSRFSFQRLTVDLSHQIPLYRRTRTNLPKDHNGPDECSQDATNHDCPGVTRDREGSVGVRLLIVQSFTPAGHLVPFYFQPTLGGADIAGNTTLVSYQDYRFRAPNLLLLRGSFEHSIYGPLGFSFAADTGKVALARGDLDFSHLVHSYAAGLTLRAGGFPQVWLQFAWGGHEGTHTIAAMNTSLLGGAARPSLY
jgi:hypothetical protein